MTREQWRAAATLSEALLDLEMARSCGLICGGPSVDVEHCRWLLRRARAQGIVTRATEVNAVTEQLVVSCGGSQ